MMNLSEKEFMQYIEERINGKCTWHFVYEETGLTQVTLNVYFFDFSVSVGTYAQFGTFTVKHVKTILVHIRKKLLSHFIDVSSFTSPNGDYIKGKFAKNEVL